MQVENNLKAAGPVSEGCTLQGLVYRQKPWISPALARPNSSESAEVMQGLCQTLQDLHQSTAQTRLQIEALPFGAGRADIRRLPELLSATSPTFGEGSSLKPVSQHEKVTAEAARQLLSHLYEKLLLETERRQRAEHHLSQAVAAAELSRTELSDLSEALSAQEVVMQQLIREGLQSIAEALRQELKESQAENARLLQRNSTERDIADGLRQDKIRLEQLNKQWYKRYSDTMIAGKDDRSTIDSLRLKLKCLETDQKDLATENEEEVRGYVTSLQKANDEMESLCDDLAARKGALARLSSQFTAKDAALAQMSSQLAAKEAALVQLSELLAAEEAALARAKTPMGLKRSVLVDISELTKGDTLGTRDRASKLHKLLLSWQGDEDNKCLRHVCKSVRQVLTDELEKEEKQKKVCRN